MSFDLSIYFDLDGVYADYSEGIKKFGFSVDPETAKELNCSGSQNPLKRQMYEAIKGTDFYRDLPIMPGVQKLWDKTKKYDPIFITAAPKFGATEEDYFINPYWLGAAYRKRIWVEDKFLPAMEGLKYASVRGNLIPLLTTHIPIADERFICTTSARKHEFMHRKKSPHQILVDDRIANCIAWFNAGGVAIHHTSPEDSLKALDWYENSDFIDNPVPLLWSAEDQYRKVRLVR